MIISSSTNNKTLINIVSGIPRSGTSMMMAMLRAGGCALLTDEVRLSDQHNPNGYFEFEQVKKLPKGDVNWLLQAQGKVLKVITALLIHLPKNYHYRIIFMHRSMTEIMASQEKMLATQNKLANTLSHIKMDELFEQHLTQVELWIKKQHNITCLEISYNRLMLEPQTEIQKINLLFDKNLNTKAMEKVINPDSYHQQFFLQKT